MIKICNHISCIDAHTAGEPLRIIQSGLPKIKGNTILEKRKYFSENYDYLRKMMMLEPRGHSGMYGCILVDAVTEDGDFGVLFTHNDGLSSMCGHGIIAVTKVVLEIGIIKPIEGKNIVKIDTPAGRVIAYANVKNGSVSDVSFENVPCFVYKENIIVDTKKYGGVRCDIVYCGAFYAYVNSSSVGLRVKGECADEFVKLGMEIKKKIMAGYKIEHPIEKGINWLYGTIFMDSISREKNVIMGKNVCIFADGQIDRSPTGTGTGGRVALHVHQGIMGKQDILINSSIINTKMEAEILGSEKIDKYTAIKTLVRGKASIIGFNQLVVEEDDTLPEGFRFTGN